MGPPSKAPAMPKAKTPAKPPRRPAVRTPDPEPTPKPLKVVERPLSSLKAYRANARKHEDAQVDAIAKSIRTFGFLIPVLIDAEGEIIAGHGRVKAAHNLGMASVPTITADHLTEAQVRAYRLADNKLTERGGWDDGQLRAELRALADVGIDMGLTGFEAGELEGLLQAADLDPIDPPAGAGGGPAADPITKPGDLWILGEHRLLCGDATDAQAVARLMDGQKAHLVNTDPPYGVSYVGKTADALTIASDELRQDGLLELLRASLTLAAEHARDTAGFYVWHASSTRRDFEAALDYAGLEERQTITWIKSHFVMGHDDYHWQTEPCFYAGKRGRKPAWYGGRAEANVWRIASADAAGERSIALGDGLAVLDGQGRALYLTPKLPKKKIKHTRLKTGEALTLLGASGESDAWEVARPSKSPDHPTAKPAELAAIAIHNSTRAGDIVLDLFGGAGFTLLAAERTKRKARLMELSPAFCDVICRRWKELTGAEPRRETAG